MPFAARRTDPLDHSNTGWGLVAGALIGVAIGIAVVGTGGGALVVLAAAGTGLSIGGGVGETVGSLDWVTDKIGGSESGPIGTGSPDVTIDGLAAARATADTVLCEGTPPIYWPSHEGKHVAQGSATVTIDGLPAARVGDKIECGAFIAQGSTDVVIGGPTVTTVGIDGEISGWINLGLLLVGGGAGIVLNGWRLTAVGILGSLAGQTALQTLAAQLGLSEDWQKIAGLLGSTGGGMLAGAGRNAILNQRIAAFNESINTSGDFSLPPGQDPALWSGPGAYKAAHEAGYGTLEDTPAGKATQDFVDNQLKGAPWSMKRQVFDNSSKGYARSIGDRYAATDPETGLPNTSADAGQSPPAFVSEHANPESVYFQGEKPLLSNDYNVSPNEIPVSAPAPKPYSPVPYGQPLPVTAPVIPPRDPRDGGG